MAESSQEREGSFNLPDPQVPGVPEDPFDRYRPGELRLDPDMRGGPEPLVQGSSADDTISAGDDMIRGKEGADTLPGGSDR